ncbi:hypothetical protein A5663_08090 [Mycobacterium sp. E740]|nr:hypothetical protein A5663_08090 [Mycobacterium sp. E740]
MDPRPARRQRDLKPLIAGAAVVGAVAVIVGGVVLWWPSADDTEPHSSAGETSSAATGSAGGSEPAQDAEQAQLLRLVPRGYPPGACKTTATPENALAQVDCDRNNDPDGPVSANYRLFGEKAALQAEFDAAIATASRVNCPGNIQSPGPWRRNATPDRVSGQLFCGLQDGKPIVVWSDEPRMTVSAVRAGADGPTFPQLYAWWSSHS